MTWRYGTWLVALVVVMALTASGQPQPSQDKDDKDDKDRDAPAVELPEGEGKVILERACTSCHDLGGLKNFKGYYTEELWRELILDMVKVGAQLKEDEISTLAKYLAEHFGPEK
jgi:cytochrome c553